MKATETNQISGIPFREFPELSRLCWSEHRELISEEEAFLLYLDEWELVDPSAMPAREIALVHRLNRKFQSRLDVRKIPPPTD